LHVTIEPPETSTWTSTPSGNSSQVTRLSISTARLEERSEEEQDFGIRLKGDLLELDIQSADFVHGGHSPLGAKGDPIAWNQLFVTLLASGGVLTAVINAAIARISAAPKRTSLVSTARRQASWQRKSWNGSRSNRPLRAVREVGCMKRMSQDHAVQNASLS
jgi:hypothetical protein